MNEQLTNVLHAVQCL